jgi:hypothetical protein
MSKGKSVGGLSFPGLPIMIGAGVCKDPKLTLDWLKIAPVVSGSYTKEQWRPAVLSRHSRRAFKPRLRSQFLWC